MLRKLIENSWIINSIQTNIYVSILMYLFDIKHNQIKLILTESMAYLWLKVYFALINKTVSFMQQRDRHYFTEVQKMHKNTLFMTLT